MCVTFKCTVLSEKLSIGAAGCSGQLKSLRQIYEMSRLTRMAPNKLGIFARRHGIRILISMQS
jgi:hypothetical protein